MKKCIGLITAVVLMVQFSTFASLITWSGPTQITNSSQLITAESDAVVVEAYNLGSASDLVVGGVTFTGGAGSVSGTTGGVDSGVDSPTENANLNTILSTFSYAPGTQTSCYLGLTGLTVGQEYTVQIFATDSRSGSRNNEMAVDRANGGPTDWDYSPWGTTDYAEFVTGTFTATNSSLSIDFEWKNNLTPTYQPGGSVVNAYAVTTVPEPTTVSFFAISSLLLLAYRRVRTVG